MFFLDLGNSLYVPFGCVPAILGVPDDLEFDAVDPKERAKRAKTAKQTADDLTNLYSIQLVLDPTHDKDQTAKTVLAVKAFYVQAADSMMPSIKKRVGESTWYDSLVGDGAGMDAA